MIFDARLAAQTNLLLANLDRAAASPPDWQRREEHPFLYREHTFLTRGRDLERVTAALQAYLASVEDEDGAEAGDGGDGGGDGGGGDGTYGPDAGDGAAPAAQELSERFPVAAVPVVGDVVRLDYAGPRARRLDRARAAVAVETLAGALGEDVLRLEAVLAVAAHPCPATEPEQVPAGTARPFPDVDTRVPCGGGHGHGGDGCHHGRRGCCQGEGVLVTVADLGLHRPTAQAHDWLAGVDGDEEDPYEADGTIRPYAGHGTFVAGCVRVAAPRAQVRVERDVEVVAASSGAAFEADVVLRLADALTRTPDVVVFEFTTTTRNDLSLMGFDELYETRIKPLKGLAFLAPAGNDPDRQAQWPAAYPWAVSVGALSANWRTRAPFSAFGGWVDVYAPGEDLVNAFPAGTYRCSEPPDENVVRRFEGMARWSGTSFATPLVAGLVAARMSCTGENGRQAADALLAFARSQAVPGVGAVLFPGQACCSPARCCCGAAPACRCGGRQDDHQL